MSSLAILSARNVHVNELNKELVSLLDRFNEGIYTSIDSIDNTATQKKKNFLT